MEFNLEYLPSYEEVLNQCKYIRSEWSANMIDTNLTYLSIEFITTKLIYSINNKKDFINLFLNKSINCRKKNINYLNILIKFLSNHEINERVLNIINDQLKLTNTCTIFNFKLENDLYNLYNFVPTNLINEFNMKLLNSLLLIYYYDGVYDGLETQYFTIFEHFLYLYLIPYNLDFPFNINSLEFIKSESKELKLELANITS
jgi:hypothetical protein